MHNGLDPSHHHIGRFPLKFRIDYILENDKEAELIINIDEIIIPIKSFSQIMNHATKGNDFLR